ncbi:MAG: hypothetical protein ACQEQ7_03360, partial [Thermodesulfobacteriota bacterium]
RVRASRYLKSQLYEFVQRFDIDLIIPENALAIPLNIPLGLALTEFIAESGFPTVAHHHDFSWERERFLVNGVEDYLTWASSPIFPPCSMRSSTQLPATNSAIERGLPIPLSPMYMTSPTRLPLQRFVQAI